MTGTYLAAALQVGTWLENVAERSADGWSWRASPAVEEVDSSLGWGTAGPPLFFVELFRTTGDKRWLEPAYAALPWMAQNLGRTLQEWAGCGLFTGVGGWVLLTHELALATGDEDVRDFSRSLLEHIVERAVPDSGGIQWSQLTEIYWGTAGIGCLLLRQGVDLLGERSVELAIKAGDWLLRQSTPTTEGGINWTFGPGFHVKFPQAQELFPGVEPRSPGFAHGTSGIGFFLARLAEVTGEPRFLQAAAEAAAWITAVARTDGGTFQTHHDNMLEPDGYTLGWCYGPPGLGWFLRQMEIAHDDPKWRELQHRAAHTDLVSGIPERRESGFWDNVARCCGSAGVAEWFLDLHALEGTQEYLEFARVMVDDLLGRAIVDDAGARWSNYEFRNEEPDLPPEVTYLQGASGIGSTLCRLDRHLRGDSWVVSWPHAPTWRTTSVTRRASAPGPGH